VSRLGNGQIESAPLEGLDLAASLVRELFVDLLGSLVPGFLFIVFATPMVLWAGAAIFRDSLHWEKVTGAVSLPGYLVFSVAIIVSYVLGCVFSRRDPKVPDQKSLRHILTKDWANLDRCVVQPRKDKERTQRKKIDAVPAGRMFRALRLWKRWRFAKNLAGSEGGQFPYSHLYEYLRCRGLDHLAQHVPWKGTDESLDKRSKMFINVLKIRIQHWNPRQCGELVRNEAHVRMMSSVWYATGLLEGLYSVLLLLLFATAYSRQTWKLPLQLEPQFPGLLVVVLFAFILGAFVLRRAIVSFLHYQRVREIIYVLETAHATWREGNRTIFEGFAADEKLTVESGHAHRFRGRRTLGGGRAS
jgi:hypothetical protein